MKNALVTFGILVGMGGAAIAQTGNLAKELNEAFAQVYEKVAPAVVVIEVKAPAVAQGVRLPPGSLPQGLDFFFRGPGGADFLPRSEQGSGFIIDSEGLILTNNHVVEGAENGRIEVRLRDGRKFDARLLGRDRNSDIAVLKVDAENLPTVELADSDSVRVGQFAFAIGAPFDLPYTFTVGVVSAKGRTNLTRTSPNYEEFIQTDASINPGNSGGPLCDLDGRVIGVNTLISGMNRGLGFAVPVNIARDVSAQLIERGRVSRPWLGIGIVGLDEDEERAAMFPGVSGVLVESIQPGTPAFRSQLQAGDVVLKVDGRPVLLASDLQREILGKEIGQVVVLDVLRGGRVSQITVRTGEQPDDIIRASFNVQPVPVPPQMLPMPADPATPQTPVPSVAGPAPRFGLVMENVGKRKGVRVTAVIEGSPAEAAGFQVGDVITEMAGRPVAAMGDFDALSEDADLSRGVMVHLDRGGEKTFAILKE